MALVSEIYQQVTYDLLEDEALQLGIIDDPDFIDFFNLTLMDFLQRTGMLKLIQTQGILSGQSEYTVPDEMMLVESVFIAGRYLESSTTEEIANASRNWRRTVGIPKVYHEDQLPIKTVEVIPIPDYDGAFIPGPNEPDGPHAQTGEWSAIIDAAVVTAPVHRGLTLVGQAKPSLVTALTDPIPLLPDEFSLSYLAWGILARIFAGDNEVKNPEQAQFCAQQYQEGITLGRAITDELMMT
jgi:hypothetical protein